MNPQKVNTFFFDVALTIYVVWGCLIDVDPSFYDAYTINTGFVGFFCVALSIISIIINYKFTFFNIIFLFLGLLNAFYLYFAYHYIIILPLVFLVFAAYKIQSNHIAKIALYSTILSTLCIIMLCGVGILTDRIYNHDFEGAVIRDAHSFGFFYYSGLAYRTIAILVLYLYLLRNSINLKTMILLLFFVFFSYYISTTRLQLIVSLSFLLFTFFSYYLHVFSFRKRKWKYIGVFSHIVILVVYFAFFLLSIFSFSDYFVFLDELMGKRLSTNIIAFSQYNLSLLGNKIEMVGAATTTDYVNQSYFYIDSGYVYWTLAYGLLFTIIIICSYSVIALRAWKNGNSFLLFWLLIYAVANISNDFFTCSYMNISIFFLFANISETPKCKSLNLKLDIINKSKYKR